VQISCGANPAYYFLHIILLKIKNFAKLVQGEHKSKIYFDFVEPQPNFAALAATLVQTE
jgi:hypothetical protein